MKYLSTVLVWLFFATIVYIVSGFISGTFVFSDMDHDVKLGATMFGLFCAVIVSGIIAEKFE